MFDELSNDTPETLRLRIEILKTALKDVLVKDGVLNAEMQPSAPDLLLAVETYISQ